MRRLAAALLACSLLAPAASAAPRFAEAPAGAPMPVAPRAETFMEAPDAPVHAPSRALVMKALARRRAANVARFRAYRKAGSYPHNYETGTTRNVWRDVDGHLCAAATMIDRSGQHELVGDIAENQTYVRLGEVTSGPLLDWILTSGLTQVEVATIQEPMMGPREPRQRDRSWQVAEDARLRKRYVRIEAALAENRASALAQAADRLIESNPQLAWTLVGDELGIGRAPRS
ncbi:MAG: hypothetical protein K8W52_42140 [Deltaproteobacteria bacterium]|nr:hypothetical protein [Deltaproteobacteria bacterium]